MEPRVEPLQLLLRPREGEDELLRGLLFLVEGLDELEDLFLRGPEGGEGLRPLPEEPSAPVGEEGEGEVALPLAIGEDVPGGPVPHLLHPLAADGPLDGLDLVAELPRLLEAESLARLLHPGPEGTEHFLPVSLEELPDPLGDLPRLLLVDLP